MSGLEASDAQTLLAAVVPRYQLDLGLADPEDVGDELDALGVRPALDRRSGDTERERVPVTTRDR